MTPQPEPAAAAISNVVGGSVTGQIATGHDIVQTTVHGCLIQLSAGATLPVPQLRPRPVSVRPRDFAGLLGRRRELEAVDRAVAAREPVGLHGASGIGKTALLRHVAHRSSLPDGVVYLDRRGGALEDVVQQLWGAFWTSPIPRRVDETEARQALADVVALVLVDDADGPSEELDAIVDMLPGCAVVLTSEGSCYRGPGTVRALAPLSEADGLALLDRELTDGLAPDARPAAVKLLAALGGAPGRIRQAALAAAESGERLADLSGTAASQLEEAHRQILGVLEAFGGAPVPGELVIEITGHADAWARLEELVGRGLAEAHSPRFTSAAGVGTAQPPELARATAAWAERQPDAEIAAAAGAITIAAQRASDRASVVRLARAADRGLFLGARWGAWRTVMQAALEAARGTRDRAGEAWALHQLGSRALIEGLRELGTRQLRQALAMRVDLGDEPGAAATRHNLGLPGGGGADPHKGGTPPRPRWPLAVAAALAAVVVAGGVSAAIRAGGDDDGDTGGSSGAATLGTPTPTRPAAFRVGQIAGPRMALIGATHRYTASVRVPSGARPSYRWSVRGARLMSSARRHAVDVTFGTAGKARMTLTVSGDGRHHVRHTTIITAPPATNLDTDFDGFPRPRDCNDHNKAVHPGATDIPGDGIDQDCSGADAVGTTTTPPDRDGDGYDARKDCNDNDAAIHPGARDIPDDGIDQDCDGVDATTPRPVDADNDGYALPADCDDADATIHPDAIDIPDDGIDQNCNGTDAHQEG